MINAFLVGRTIYLKPLSADDVSEDYVSWFNDAQACRDNGHHRFPHTAEKASDYVRGVQGRPDAMVFAIRRISDDVHVGNIALDKINWIDRSADISIMIGRADMRGKGVGTEAYGLVVRHAVKALNLRRLTSGFTSRNVAMRKVAEHAGMRKEGLLRQALFKDGEYLDIELFAYVAGLDG